MVVTSGRSAPRQRRSGQEDGTRQGAEDFQAKGGDETPHQFVHSNISADREHKPEQTRTTCEKLAADMSKAEGRL